MVRLYHLSVLLVASLVAATAMAADLPGGKKVTITMRPVRGGDRYAGEEDQDHSALRRRRPRQ